MRLFSQYYLKFAVTFSLLYLFGWKIANLIASSILQGKHNFDKLDDDGVKNGKHCKTVFKHILREVLLMNIL